MSGRTPGIKFHSHPFDIIVETHCMMGNSSGFVRVITFNPSVVKVIVAIDNAGVRVPVLLMEIIV